MNAKKAPGVAPTTTEGHTTERANALQHIPHTTKEHKDMNEATPKPFRAGDRFRVRALGDRYDGTAGTVRRVYTAYDGRQYADVTHDDGAITTWPVSRLEQELPELAQRVRGATLTDHYVDAGVDTSRTPLVDRHECGLCGWTLHSTRPAVAGEPDDFAKAVAAHIREHDENEAAPNDLGKWSCPAGDVILYRRPGDGQIAVDLLADDRIDSLDTLNELVKMIKAAASTWEAAL